jgi:phospholipid transport system substrate-binding protein
MKSLFAVASFIAALMIAVPLARAQAIAPDVLMKTVTEEVISAIQADKDIRAGDSAKIAALVEAKIVPHFDFRRTTQIAMGAVWRLASPEQQDQLTAEFTKLLLRTYSGALAGYRNQTIEFRPLRARPDDAEVTVRSQVRQPGTEPIAIEYDLARTESGWKVFDVRVAGISLVATYRTTFAEEVRNHGIEGLIGALSSKNREAMKRVSVKT